ncbi:ATP-binding protein [Streptacidiphilus cavernicola]|uniref:ATP-binding protein n=1 Tax=Streptacidiphilus cavernicola TaxID=3342716 RepID=A0ABV6W0D9_9ACTN
MDALLHDLGRRRLAARAVAGVDSPERFAELFPVLGWRPVDAALQISDVPALVGVLGGEQLYGREPEVAVRELIQNAQDAVMARTVVDPDFTDGRVEVRLSEVDGEWVLEVGDNGVGMDEDLLVHSLLDFGRSGWSSNRVRKSFPGLAGGGFKPRGRFGIGFFSVFMLGDQVELVTRRYDGAQADARRLGFDGLDRRPLLTAVQAPARVAPGTLVRVVLKHSPFTAEGILRRTEDDRLGQLIERLALESTVPVRSWEPRGGVPDVLPPFSLETGTADQVFDRLYPPLTGSWRFGLEKQRVQLREAFVQRATELFDDSGRRIGLAALGPDLLYWNQLGYMGIVPVNGFLGDESIAFAGYLEGLPNRASRDQVDLVADRAVVSRWFSDQERRLRETGDFSDSVQLELAYTFQRVLGRLGADFGCGMTSEGVLRPGRMGSWAAQRSEIFLAMGMPLSWNTRPPQVIHYLSGTQVRLPDDWVSIFFYSNADIFLGMFPDSYNRDPAYEFSRDQPGLAWEKVWWRMSGNLHGLLLREICRAWSCDVGDLLAPVAQRQWSDFMYLEDASLGPVFGYLLRRP